eukprot:gene57856-biopygen36693
MNTGINAGVSDVGNTGWTTFAHELGHNFGAPHSFEYGQGSTGGIMDYGDGFYQGDIQFNRLRTNDVCKTFEAIWTSGSPAPQPTRPGKASRSPELRLDPDCKYFHEHSTDAPTQATDTPTDATSAPTDATPVTDAPKTSAPKTSAPITDAPKTSAPVTSAPVTSAPVTDAPQTSAPVTSAPVTDAPQTSAPVTSAPVTDAPQ